MITEDQLSQCFNENYQRFLNLANLYIHDRSDAEDAVQNAFLGTWKNRETFESRSTLKTYVTIAIVNAALHIGRGRTNQRIAVGIEVERLLIYDPQPSQEWLAMHGQHVELARKLVERVRGAKAKDALLLMLANEKCENRMACRLRRMRGLRTLGKLWAREQAA